MAKVPLLALIIDVFFILWLLRDSLLEGLEVYALFGASVALPLLLQWSWSIKTVLRRLETEGDESDTPVKRSIPSRLKVIRGGEAPGDELDKTQRV